MRPRQHGRFVLIGLCWLYERSDFYPPPCNSSPKCSKSGRCSYELNTVHEYASDSAKLPSSWTSEPFIMHNCTPRAGTLAESSSKTSDDIPVLIQLKSSIPERGTVIESGQILWVSLHLPHPINEQPARAASPPVNDARPHAVADAIAEHEMGLLKMQHAQADICVLTM